MAQEERRRAEERQREIQLDVISSGVTECVKARLGWIEWDPEC